MPTSTIFGVKTCSKCGIEKTLDGFQKNKARLDGVETYCRECNNERIRQAYAANPKKKIAQTRKYHLANPEWSKRVQKEWHTENRDSQYAKVKKRLITDPEFRQYRRDMSKLNSHKRRAQQANTEVTKVTRNDLNNILNEFNNQCWICSVELTQVCWDHVHPLSKGGAHSVNNLRPACVNCNSRKSATWPFTDDMKKEIANEVRALRTPQEHSIPVRDGLEV